MKNQKRLVVFPSDPISAYYAKGEIKERYFNPCDLFDEVHVISPCDTDIEANRVDKLAGRATLTIYPLGYLSVSDLFRVRSGMPRLLNARRRVLRILAGIRPDVLRAYDPLVQGMLAAHCGARLGIKTIVSIHGDYDEEREFKRKRIGARQFLEYYLGSRLSETYCLGKANAIIAVTKFVASYARRHGGRRINIIYNRVDMDRFAPSTCPRYGKAFTVISVGRQTPQKNQACLIRAVRNIDANLVLIGDGELHDSLVALAKELSVESRVKFIRSVPHQEMHSFYTSCDVFAISSHFEGFCIPVLEAMACALPVVAANIPPLSEIVGEAGILVPHDPTAFEQAFGTLMTNRALRESLAKKARKRALQYDGRVMEQAEASLYTKAFSRRCVTDSVDRSFPLSREGTSSLSSQSTNELPKR